MVSTAVFCISVDATAISVFTRAKGNEILTLNVCEIVMIYGVIGKGQREFLTSYSSTRHIRSITSRYPARERENHSETTPGNETFAISSGEARIQTQEHWHDDEIYLPAGVIGLLPATGAAHRFRRKQHLTCSA